MKKHGSCNYPCSNCCKALILTVGGIEGMYYWKCSSCLRPCDVYSPKTGKSFFDLSLKEKKSIVSKAAKESNRAQKATVNQVLKPTKLVVLTHKEQGEGMIDRQWGKKTTLRDSIKHYKGGKDCGPWTLGDNQVDRIIKVFHTAAKGLILPDYKSRLIEAVKGK